MRPLLTIILTVDSEKPDRLMDYYVAGLARWNRCALAQVQLLVLTQRPCDFHTHLAVAKLPVAVDVIHARHELAGAYPVWSIVEPLRDAWGLVRGEYVTFAHTEFLWLPDRLGRSLRFLRNHRPVFALGNLRRPGPFVPNDYQRGRERPFSQQVTDLLDRREWISAAVAAENLPTAHWVYWEGPPKSGPVDGWAEDVFFARKDWLEAVRFLHHGDRLYFQDVYDLMGGAFQLLGGIGLAPPVVRMGLDTHQAIHLWHETPFDSWRPEVRDWFMCQPRRFRGTSFLDGELWDRLIGPRNSAEWAVAYKALSATRRSRLGTLTRFMRAMEGWLAGEGSGQVADYYQREESQPCERLPA